MLRIAFAQSAIFGARHILPCWYPRELLGAPFSANLQNFPWIPTRLIVLLVDPTLSFSLGVAIAAALAALFTYLYCRRVGLSEIGSISAAWTFASAGFFASRVLAGQFALLEAYPSLPLLLWLADRAVSPDRTQYQIRDAVALAFASACVAVAGHPQLPAYSLGATLLYVLLRGRGWARVRILSSIILGLGTTLAAWWPMLLLSRRSTRLLKLAEPSNDIAMPYRRLLSLIWPGVDGWPDSFSLSSRHLFGGYPNVAFFWDTYSYVGLLPLFVILVLLCSYLARRRRLQWPWAFLWALGVGALIFALPLTEPLRQRVPGMFLRSPARLLYLSTFCASVALGFGVSAFLERARLKLRLKQGVVAFCLILHIFDLSGSSRLFVQTSSRKQPAPPFEQILSKEVDAGRIAAEWQLRPAYVDHYDDAGIYDSILLANPYHAILGLNGSPPDLNEQDVDASALNLQSLQGAGVRFVVTSTEREDLKVRSESEDAYLYGVPDPTPRAAFFSISSTDFLPGPETLDAFLSHPRSGRLLLPREARAYIPAGAVYASQRPDPQPAVIYERPWSDEIRVRTSTEQAGFVQVLESHDPGWSAAVDGVHAPVLLANGFSMAIPVAPGRHEVCLRYETPGRATGLVFSLLSMCALAGLLWTGRKQ